MKSLSRKPAGTIDFAEHGFRIAIDRRGIDQTAAAGNQRLQDGRRFLPGGVVVAVEDVSRAKPDGRQQFTASRDRAHKRRGVLRGGRNGEHRGAPRESKFASRQADGHARSPVIASPFARDAEVCVAEICVSRVGVTWRPSKLGPLAVDERRAMLLRAAEHHRQDEPAGRGGQRDERNGAELEPERLQAVEHPAVQSVRAAIDHDIDQILGFVFLLAADHGEKHLARRIGDGEIHPALHDLQRDDDRERRRQKQARRSPPRRPPAKRRRRCRCRSA